MRDKTLYLHNKLNYVIRLLQRLIFAIEWHHCESNILLIKIILLGDALATITDTMSHFCSEKNLVLFGFIGITTLKSRLSLNSSFYCINQFHRLKFSWFFKYKSQLFANIIRSCRSVVVRGLHFVAIPSHYCRIPSYIFGISQKTRTL